MTCLHNLPLSQHYRATFWYSIYKKQLSPSQLTSLAKLMFQMAKYLTFLFLMLKLATTFASQLNSLNETCLDDIGFDLQIDIYRNSCPEAEAIIFSGVENAVSQDSRMAASLLRLHFHDCFVNASSLNRYICILIFL